jgi:peptide-methionine (S)-S-oxide reductase
LLTEHALKIQTLLVALVTVLGFAAGPVRSQAAEPRAVLRTAAFAGGCFWCEEAAFDEIPGVTNVVSGYTGGRVANPTYEQVSAENTGHAESVQVTYDPAKISYARLLEIFWRNVDPFDAGGQFCDRGDSYRSEIFVATAEERLLAEQSKAALEKRFGRALATRITAATRFYPAEDYHQDYHRVNPLRYRYYRAGCGRDARLDKVWGAEARPKS